MPIQLPNLDTKLYDNILDEVIASIPKYSDKWTNHNPSDPGITILEFLSWIAETTLYRINRIPDESSVNFLRLVSGAWGIDEVDSMLNDPNLDRFHREILDFLKDVENGTEKSRSEIKAASLTFLNSRYRAVTEKDFRKLAIEATDSVLFHTGDVKDQKSLSIKLRDAKDPLSKYIHESFSSYTKQILESYDGIELPSRELKWAMVVELNKLLLDRCIYDEQRFASIKLTPEIKKQIEIEPHDEELIKLNRLLLVQAYPDELETIKNHARVKRAIVQESQTDEKIEIVIVSDMRDKYEGLIDWVWNYLYPRRLIGTLIEVKKAVYTKVKIDIEVICLSYAKTDRVEKSVKDRVVDYLDPFTGGPEKDGWPYKRPLTIYEVVKIVEDTNGVERTASLIFDDSEELTFKPIGGLVDPEVYVKAMEEEESGEK